MRSRGLVGLNSLCLINHTHESAEGLGLAFAVFLAEINYLVFDEATVIIFEIEKESLNCQLHGVESLRLNLVDKVFISY